jgi:hypothetical protein
MRRVRIHRKVFLWWGRWWACQAMLVPELSLGVRVEWRTPLLALFVGPVTLLIGNYPVLRDVAGSQRYGAVGFIVKGTPEEALL